MDRAPTRHRRLRRAFFAPLLAAFFLLATAAAAQAETIVVNTSQDPTGAGDCLNRGQCSPEQPPKPGSGPR